MADEIKEERLDSPLVVHKKDDASYQETAGEISMNATHTDEESGDTPTLERHRFRKKKKKKKAPYIILVLVAVAAAVICALIYNGIIPVTPDETTTTTRKSYTTQQENKFEGIITVKGTYIFFEGEEVNGIKGLEDEVKYLDEGTSFVVQDENAESNFFNFEVLDVLTRYNIKFEVKHIVSSGLISNNEATSAAQTESTSATQETQTSAAN